MLNGNDIIQLGYKAGPEVGQAIKLANQLASKGASKDEIIKSLIDQKPKDVIKLKLRDKPLTISMAAEPSNQEEEANLIHSKKKMEELSLCPVIEQAVLMPDTCPSGQEYGCIPVGGGILTKNHVIPAAHSADVCCSMRASFFESNKSVKELISDLNSCTHFGPFGRPRTEWRQHQILQEDVWGNPFLKGLEESAQGHLQTQGDGNHFAYIGEIHNIPQLIKEFEGEGYYDEAKSLTESGKSELLVLVTHHGSRKLGAQIYKRGIEEAVRYTENIANNIPKSMAWLDLDTQKGRDYWQALQYAEKWTIANHNLIHNSLIFKTCSKEFLRLGNAHNFVWRNNYGIAHGKGATPAWLDTQGRKQIGIIPLNMASPILITFGLDNKDFLSFSPHGAGRNKSRSQTLKEFYNQKTKQIDAQAVAQSIKSQTEGLEILWASNKPDLSETPIGYKNAKQVEAQLEKFGLAKIACKIKPKGCIMAGEFEPAWKKVKEDKKRLKAKNMPSMPLE